MLVLNCTFSSVLSICNTIVAIKFFLKEDATGFLCAIVDGLGSGKEAEKAAKAVVEVIGANNTLPNISDIVALANEALVGLRGAAIAIWRGDWDEQTITYCGIGNIRFYLLGTDDALIFPISSTGFLSGRKQKNSDTEVPIQARL